MLFTSFRSATVNFPNHLCGSIYDSSGRENGSSLEFISSHLTLYPQCLYLSGENCSTQSDRSFNMTPAVKSKRCACFSSFCSASVNRNLRCESGSADSCTFILSTMGQVFFLRFVCQLLLVTPNFINKISSLKEKQTWTTDCRNLHSYTIKTIVQVSQPF